MKITLEQVIMEINFHTLMVFILEWLRMKRNELIVFKQRSYSSFDISENKVESLFESHHSSFDNGVLW